MLLQTNSYIVPAEKRIEHQRLIKRFRQAMAKLGCESFDVYEQVGPNWAGNETSGRFVQIMRFRDHQHQRQVQAAERSDPTAQALIAEFCEVINLPYQQQQGLFAVGFYRSVVPVGQSGPQAQAPGAGGTEPFGQAATEGAGDEVPIDGTIDQAQPFEETSRGENAENVSYGMPGGDNGAAYEEVEGSVTEGHGFSAEGTEASEHQQNDPPALDEIDIEALAEEEIGGFQEVSEDSNDRRKRKG
ncbi:MAG TPA: hypothetical protein VF669_14045 [Tepidisphaeraceae bacterium]|jgi:hypothetical protein